MRNYFWIFGVFVFSLITSCQPTPDQVKYAIYQTALSYTVTPGKTLTPLPIDRSIEERKVPTFEPTETVNSLRLNTFAVRENTNVIWDTSASDEYVELVNIQVRNLAIAKPFHWEYYATNKLATWDDVVKHYKSKASARKYNVRREEFNADINMGLMSFGKGNANIYVQFWADDQLILVVYKNVES